MLERKLLAAPIWLSLALLCACGGSNAPATALAEDPPPGQDPPPGDEELTGPQPTIESIQEEVFGPRCSSCHTGDGAPHGLRLTDVRTSYNNLVDVRSAEMPLQMRVAPGDPEESYLVDKLEGTAMFGQQMPPGGTVTPERIAAIREWITRGAPPPGDDEESVFLPVAELPGP